MGLEVNAPLLENFPCPGCAKPVLRPVGATTLCRCGVEIPQTTPDQRIVQGGGLTYGSPRH